MTYSYEKRMAAFKALANEARRLIEKGEPFSSVAAGLGYTPGELQELLSNH